MAKGGRGGRRGGGVAKGELTLPDGSKIEFDGDLVFGELDKAVPDAVRKNLDDWENKRSKAKIEYGMSYYPDGTPIGKEIRGGKGSVRCPWSYHATEGATFTHNHPRGDGMLGGTFSGADLRNFAFGGNTTSRATAKEGTYSISKGKNFNKFAFNQYVAKVEADVRKTYKSEYKKISEKYKNNEISYDQATLMQGKAFNTFLVNLHNAYRDGQKQYGYTYTLEKRN